MNERIGFTIGGRSRLRVQIPFQGGRRFLGTLPGFLSVESLAAGTAPTAALPAGTIVGTTLEGDLVSAQTFVTVNDETADLANSRRLVAGTNVTFDTTAAGQLIINVSVGAHDLLSATHSDTLAAAVVDGDIIIGNSTPRWSRLAISIPAANVRNVLGIDNGDLRPSWKTALDATAPTTIAPSDVAASGTSLVFSHRDHVHGAPATFPASAHALLSATHSDVVVQIVSRGSLIRGNSTPAWDELVIGAAGAVLWSDGTDPSWETDVNLAGYIRVGSASSPINTAAGEITANRLIIVNGALVFGTPRVQVSASMTDTAAGATAFVHIAPTIEPAINSSSEFRTLNFDATIEPTSGVTLNVVEGGNFNLRLRQDANITRLTVVQAGIGPDSGAPAAMGTVAAAQVFLALANSAIAASQLTYTVFVAFDADVFSGNDAGDTIIGTLINFRAQQPGTGYTITTHIGVDIEQLTRATTNIGLRNASTTVYTPSTAQNLAAGTAIVVNATVLQITSTGSVTLTGTPTIADGQNGQIIIIINVDSADTITLQDQGTLAGSNLRLSAATVALGPRDSIALMFNSTIGDWVQWPGNVV